MEPGRDGGRGFPPRPSPARNRPAGRSTAVALPWSARSAEPDGAERLPSPLAAAVSVVAAELGHAVEVVVDAVQWRQERGGDAALDRGSVLPGRVVDRQGVLVLSVQWYLRLASSCAGKVTTTRSRPSSLSVAPAAYGGSGTVIRHAACRHRCAAQVFEGAGVREGA